MVQVLRALPLSIAVLSKSTLLRKKWSGGFTHVFCLSNTMSAISSYDHDRVGVMQPPAVQTLRLTNGPLTLQPVQTTSQLLPFQLTSAVTAFTIESVHEQFAPVVVSQVAVRSQLSVVFGWTWLRPLFDGQP